MFSVTRTDTRKIYKVAELTRLVKSAIERGVGSVWVEGELSNVRRPVSGHYYFTIKDETSQLSAVLFRGSQRGLRFELKDGVLVRAFGDVTVYERGGNYQIIVRQLEEGGKGSLQARFEELKKKLAEEGLFAKERKRPLPLLPRRVGVVTSATGAAIRDILNVISRRFPNLHIVLAPAKVQGEGAADEIAAGIDLLNAHGGLDVMIVGRGGGSIEDLWCFNEEAVARALARSAVPTISAVGHEIDYTIGDFVADLRAPTPSAAAELVVGCKDEFEEHLRELGQSLERSLRDVLFRYRSRVERAAGSYVFREPLNIVRQFQQRMDAASMRMTHEVGAALRTRRQRIREAGIKLDHGLRVAVGTGAQHLEQIDRRMRHRVELELAAGRQSVLRLERQLRALSPLGVLERGYSLTRRKDGGIVRRAEQVSAGDRLVTQVADGSFASVVCAGAPCDLVSQEREIGEKRRSPSPQSPAPAAQGGRGRN